MQHISSRETITLFKINGVFGFALALGEIFLQVFLFTLGGFQAVIKYNLISTCFIVVFAFFAGWLLTRTTSKNLLLMGLSGYIALFLLLFLFRENSLSLLVFLGMLHGMATGLFWAAMNLLQYVYTTDETRYRFFGTQSFLFSVTGGIAPIIGGIIISLSGALISKEAGYATLFFCIALLMSILFWEVKKISEQKHIQFSFCDMTRHRRSRVWNLVLINEFFYGLFDFLLMAFIPIFIFIIVKEEFVLGVLNAAAAVAASCAALFARFILTKKSTSFILTSFLSAFGLLMFSYQQNWWGIAALIIFYYATMPILNVAASKIIFKIIDSSSEHSWQYKYHFFLEREIMLNIGRIVSFFILILFIEDIKQFNISHLIIGTLAVLPLCIGFILYRMRYIINS